MMEFFAYPDRLQNLAIEAFGKHISILMRQLVETYSEEKNIRPCNENCTKLKEAIVNYVPITIANDVSIHLIRHLNLTYTNLKKTKYKKQCAEVGPLLLNAILHPSVMRLECFEGKDKLHPTEIDCYKLFDSALVYQATLSLRNLKALRIGYAMSSKSHFHFPTSSFKFGENFKELSVPHCNMQDIINLTKFSKNLTVLDIGGNIPFDIGYSAMLFFKFRNLEELKFGKSFLTDGELLEILQRLTLKDRTSNFPPSLLLKRFSCWCPTPKHIDLLVDKFPNLTTLKLNCCTISFTPLKVLQNLKHLFIRKSEFSLLKDLLLIKGGQLVSLGLHNVNNIDLNHIDKYCASLNCFQLFLGSVTDIVSPKHCSATEYNKYSLPDFKTVQCLHLSCSNLNFLVYLASCFTYVKNLYIVDYCSSECNCASLLQTFVQQKGLGYLVLNLRECFEVVKFYENIAVITTQNRTNDTVSLTSVKL